MSSYHINILKASNDLDRIRKVLYLRYNKLIILIKLTFMIKSGYFSSRSEILQWINDVLGVEILKIQQLGSGQIYCRILEAAYPGKVPLNRIKRNAVNEIESLHNFRIIQNAFTQLGIQKTIDIQRLAKSRYQQNLQLIQWMKQNISSLISQNRHNQTAVKKNNSQKGLFSTIKKSTIIGSSNKKILDSKRANKENKQNIYRSISPKIGINLLKSHRSADKFKGIKLSQNDLRRVFQKAETLKALLEPEYYGTQNIQSYYTGRNRQIPNTDSANPLRQWKQKTPYKTDCFNYL